MTVKDIMTLLESPDRVRVIKDGEEIYNQYFANMRNTQHCKQVLRTPLFSRFGIASG